MTDRESMQAKQEPINPFREVLYTGQNQPFNAGAQREFIGLDETDLIALQLFKGNLIDLAKWVEAKLRGKNA